MTEEKFHKAQDIQSDIVGIENLLNRIADNHFSCDGIHGPWAEKITKKLKKDLKSRLKYLKDKFEEL
jgi:hypothetical protein